MIVYDLVCRDGGETFEAWFRSGEDFAHQSAGGMVLCPLCGSANVAKAPMAPRLPRKGSNRPLERLVEAQAKMLEDSRWVGDKFADTARAMHAGEVEPEVVHGSTTASEAKSQIEEGVPVAPLPLPVVPPSQVN
jgi:hypothetical protein